MFQQEGALDRLEGFSSEYGPRFYGLPLNTDTVTLVREDQLIPSRLSLPQAARSGNNSLPEAEWPLLFHSGETLTWCIEMNGQSHGN